MITVIRNNFMNSAVYKWVLWALILVLAIVWTMPSLIRDKRESGWIATINGYTVGYADFARKTMAQDEILQAFKARFGKKADSFLKALGRSNDPRELALQELVRQELLNQAAAKLGLYVHATIVQDKLNNFEFIQQELSDLVPLAVLDQAGINMRQLLAYLHNAGLSLKTFEYKVEQAITRSMMLDIVAGQKYVPNFELQEQYQRIFAGKSFEVLIWPFEDFVNKAKENPATDQQVKEFFDQSNARTQKYRTIEKRDGIVWRFDAKSYQAPITDDAIESRYQAAKSKKYVESPAQMQVRTIVVPVASAQAEKDAHNQVQNLHRELVANPDMFAQKSKDPLVVFVKGSQEAALDRAAFTLAKDGDISEPIRSQKGFEIIQRVSYKNAAFVPLSKVKDQIKQELETENFASHFAQDVQDLLSRKDDQAVLDFASAHRAKSETVSGVVSEKDDKVAQALFDLKENGLSFFVDNGTAVLVKLTKIVKPSIPPFETIKDTVLEDYYQSKAFSIGNDIVEKALEKSTTTSFDDIADELAAELEDIPMVAKKNVARLSELRKDGFPIDRMIMLEKVGSVMVHADKENAYIIRVQEVSPLDPAGFDEKKEEAFGTLTAESEQRVIGSFVASLYRNATIKLNETLLQAQ